MDATASRITARAVQIQSQRLGRLTYNQHCLCRLSVVQPRLPSRRSRSSASRTCLLSPYSFNRSFNRSLNPNPKLNLNTKTSPSPSPSPSPTMNPPQAVEAPLTKSATFLVLTIDTDSPSAIKTVRSALSSIDSLAKNVSLRDLNSRFSCAVGIGSRAWDALASGSSLRRPSELHPFREIRGAKHSAVSTPGDLLFHIRSDRRDVCFEFERQLIDLLGDAASVVDETQGFRYFDARDLLGFVDGTANPVGAAVPDAVLIADEDSACAGGSYVVVQKYLHDIKRWRGLPTETQEAIIGRTKMDNVELDDQPQGLQQPHKTLTTVVDGNGDEHSILRDNMPFGSPGSGVFGTYFIGYSRRLWVIEKMLERMFVGDPPGKHDRILDFSTALTGTTFYAPPASVLRSLGSA
ncbi:hypothetical protein V8C37DRAFT_418419 [Trichoderma ceciliae]